MSKLEWNYRHDGEWRSKSGGATYEIAVNENGTFDASQSQVRNGLEMDVSNFGMDSFQAAKDWCQDRESELNPKRPLGLPWADVGFIRTKYGSLVFDDHNRAFVVEACNAYHGLLEDKKRLRDALETIARWEVLSPELSHFARKALKETA